MSTNSFYLKTYCYLLLLIGASNSLYAQGFNLVDRLFFQNPVEEIYILTKSVFADSNKVFSAGTSLVKLDSGKLAFKTLLSAYDMQGNKIFQKNLEIPDCERNSTFGYNCIQKVGTNQYVIGGGGGNLNVLTYSGGIFQPYLIWFDGDGNILKTITLLDSNIIREQTSVTVLPNGEIIITGNQGSTSGFVDYNDWGPLFISHYSDFWLCKLDKDGNLLWHRNYPNMRSIQWGAMPTKLIVSPDQTTYTIAGTLDYGKPYLMQCDSAGNELWHKALPLKLPYETYEYIESQLPQASIDIAAAESGFYFCASTPFEKLLQDTLIGRLGFYYGKMNADGDTLWTKMLNPYGDSSINFGRQIRVAPNGDLIMTGNLNKYLQPPLDRLEDRTAMFRTDSMGNVKWYREPMHYIREQNVVDVNIYHELYSLCLVPGKDQMLAGGLFIGYYDPFASTHSNLGNTYSWLILTDSLGQRCAADTIPVDVPNPCGSVLTPWPGGVAIESPTDAKQTFTLYPNPATDKMYIKLDDYTNQTNQDLMLQFFDIKGQQIMQQTIKVGTSPFEIDIAALHKGIYLLQLWQNGKKAGFWKLVKW